jgi:hypothetical protein
MKYKLISATLMLAAGTAMAQEFGTQDDQAYAEDLWQAMVSQNLAGEGAVQAFPYEGTTPHGVMLETFYTETSVDGHTGALVIKRNYGAEDVTVDDVLDAPADHLQAVTIMFRRAEGYAPDSGDWFWAKYLPDGTLDQTPDGTAIAGLAQGCIACHSGAGEDYLFTTDAELR